MISFRNPMKGHRERRQQLEDYLMVHTRGCLYADENDQGVGEELTVKKGKDTYRQDEMETKGQ